MAVDRRERLDELERAQPRASQPLRIARAESIGAGLDARDLQAKIRRGLGWKLTTAVFGQGTRRLALDGLGLAAAPRLTILAATGTLLYFLFTLAAAPQLVRDLRIGLRGGVPATT